MCIVDTSRWNIALAAAVAAAAVIAAAHTKQTYNTTNAYDRKEEMWTKNGRVYTFTVFDSRIHTKGIRNSSSFSATFLRVLVMNFDCIWKRVSAANERNILFAWKPTPTFWRSRQSYYDDESFMSHTNSYRFVCMGFAIRVTAICMSTIKYDGGNEMNRVNGNRKPIYLHDSYCSSVCACCVRTKKNCDEDERVGGTREGKYQEKKISLGPYSSGYLFKKYARMCSVFVCGVFYSNLNRLNLMECSHSLLL